MNTIYTINDTFTNGYLNETVDMFSVISIICGIMVLVTKNPVISVLFLIGLFLSIATYLILLGITFIGLSYLLVYVGAVSILFLFILMLINVRISELTSETNNSIPLAIIISIGFNYCLYKLLPSNLFFIASNFTNLNNIKYVYKNKNDYTNNIENLSKDLDIVYYTTSNSWDSNLHELSHISSIGNVMYTNYSIWLILTSLILLLAMVGAIIITLKNKE